MEKTGLWIPRPVEIPFGIRAIHNDPEINGMWTSRIGRSTIEDPATASVDADREVARYTKPSSCKLARSPSRNPTHTTIGQRVPRSSTKQLRTTERKSSYVPG
ncbi:hypothetical protein BX600DRAFT_200251 [Xylariales sp. PMI_506]|nr:hypothetical protein BX600DRAFT_200251 [Xylariales sp. PMI_506]